MSFVFLLILFSSMKFLSTWLRNWARRTGHTRHRLILNEVPEHMAQELRALGAVEGQRPSSMKFLSTWLRNQDAELVVAVLVLSSMKFLSTWLRNSRTSRS